jgi:hypothetical protein
MIICERQSDVGPRPKRRGSSPRQNNRTTKGDWLDWNKRQQTETPLPYSCHNDNDDASGSWSWPWRC